VKELPPRRSPPILLGVVRPSSGGRAVSNSFRHYVEEKVPRPITGGAQRSSPRIEWWCVELRAAAGSFTALLRPRAEGGGGPATRAPAGEDASNPAAGRPACARGLNLRSRAAGERSRATSATSAPREGRGLDSRPPERQREEGKGLPLLLLHAFWRREIFRDRNCT
jgi:hypothetical protein